MSEVKVAPLLLTKYCIDPLFLLQLKPYVAHDTPTKLEVVAEKTAT
jgi:hypothetical protein